jgi:hypothetical protein
MKFVWVNDGTPRSNLLVCGVVSPSRQAISEESEPGSFTAIMIAAPITARVPSWLSQVSPQPRWVFSRHLK